MTVRWGIAGTGGIAQLMAETLRDVPGAELAAVGSRHIGKAHIFADAHGVPMWAPYEELVTAPFVDVIYVAGPASIHYEHAKMALQAGKHVLVEKPFTVNAAQAGLLKMLAESRGLFLMEAAWQRFLPSWCLLRSVLDERPIGELRMLQAAFGGKADYRPELRPFRNDLAGGALMDGGVYPVSLAHMVLGKPDRVTATAEMLPCGVDGQNGMILDYADNRFAILTSAISTTLDSSARIYGTEGMIEIPSNFINPPWFRVLYPGQEPVTYDCPAERPRLAYEIDEVHRCLAAGLIESPVMTVAESCAIMCTLNKVRRDIGLWFSQEAEAI